ncbi:putative LRR receptor-like serine/threonine-protein kinase [Glycine max]|nr:putative LRR receptor-like serine/threonine-protein kinase [Glycine max]
MEMHLPCLQLGGRLNERISKLRMLRKISLCSNSFNETIPSLFSKCSLLRSVLLRDDLFSGNLPPKITNLTSLQILKVAQNHISDNIPSKLPINLKSLGLSSNAFSSEIPSFIVSISHVQLINLSYNQFSSEPQGASAATVPLGGPQPHQRNASFGACQLLYAFASEHGGNVLTGVVPLAISALPRL